MEFQKYAVFAHKRHNILCEERSKNDIITSLRSQMLRHLTEEDYAFLTDNVDRVIQKGKYTRKELIMRINTAIKESNLKMYMKGN